ncbi:uncharacterized protein LOC122849776 [Aphidius gifuensis]|nr:uncharacterized protein LOC122849776 [Aphidius gifuensis]
MDIFVNNKRCSNIFLPTVFTTELNKKLIEPTSDTNASEEIKGPRYFRGNGLITILLDGDKLQFKFDNSDETYIVSQEVHVKAFNDPAAQIQKNGGLKILTRLDLDDLRAYDAKLTFKTPTGGDSRTYETRHLAPLKQWNGFGVDWLMEIAKKTAELNPAAVAEYPGRVKLQFPMDLSLQGFKHIIKVKETGETFEVCHTVNIKVLKKSGDKINKESKNLKFDAIIQSGDIYFKTLYGSHQGLRLRYEVSMKVNDNNEIYIIPLTKYGMI